MSSGDYMGLFDILMGRSKTEKFPNGEKDLDFYADNIVRSSTDGVRSSYNIKISAYETLKTQYEDELGISPSEDIDKRFYANLISKISIDGASSSLNELFMGDNDEKSVLWEHIPKNFSLKNRTIYKDVPFDRAIQALLFANFEDKCVYESIIPEEERLFELPKNELDIIDYYFNEVAHVELGNEYDKLNERLNKTLREQAEYRTGHIIPSVIKKAEIEEIPEIGQFLLERGMDKYTTVKYLSNLLVRDGRITSKVLLDNTLAYISRNNESDTTITKLQIGKSGSETVAAPLLDSIFFEYLEERGINKGELDDIMESYKY